MIGIIKTFTCSSFQLRSRIKPPTVLRLLQRCNSVWTPEKVVKSPFDDITIPDVSLIDYIWNKLEQWPEKTAVICGITGRQIKYKDVYRLSRRFAVSLRTKFNLRDGDVVCIMLPNVPEYALATLGTLQAGCIVTTISPVYTSYEVQRQVDLSKAKVIVTSPGCLDTVTKSFEAAKKSIPVIIVRAFGEDSLPDTVCFNELCKGDDVNFELLNDVRREPDDVCVLPYSSGTTGLPKGVELTNRNLVANFEQTGRSEVKHNLETTGDHQDTVLQVLPAYHIYGLSIVMLHKLTCGCKLVTLPVFQPNSFIDALVKYQINLLYAVPPIILFMSSNKDVNPKHLESLHSVVSAAAPLPLSDVHALLDKSKNKINFIQAYGLTETSPMVTTTLKSEVDYSSVGYALSNTELKIVNKDCKSVGPNEVGELYIRGPQVMKGYRENKEATAHSITEDGWFKSGDLASIDSNGAVKIADRLKELIKVKGYQVAPAELENVLREHPGILDAAVIGFSHHKLGEVPKAFVVANPDHKLDDLEIMEFVAKRVAPYKKIQEVKFVNELPKTASGKILRRLLKEKN